MLQRLNRISYRSMYTYYKLWTVSRYINFGSTSYILRRTYICLFRIMSTTTLNRFPKKTMSTYTLYIYILFFFARVVCFLFVNHRMILPLLYFCLIHDGVSSLYISSDYQILNRYQLSVIRCRVPTYLNKEGKVTNIINI